MLIRERADGDLPDCVEALTSVHAANGYPTKWPPDPPDWLSPVGLAAAWIAIDDGSVLGHVCVVRDVNEPAAAAHLGVPPTRLASISRLFVTPAARGRGLLLGSKLLAAAQDWTDAHGLTLVLEVAEDGGPAVSFYERLGWTCVERRDADWVTPRGRRLRVRILVAPPAKR